MPEYRAIDLVGLPFTRRVRGEVYYPFYAKCCELGVPVQIRVGKAWQRFKIKMGHPAAFDAIAVHFPELKLLDTVEQLGLQPETRRKLLYDKTKRVYGL